MELPQMTVRQVREALADRADDEIVKVWLPGRRIALHQVLPFAKDGVCLIEGNEEERAQHA